MYRVDLMLSVITNTEEREGRRKLLEVVITFMAFFIVTISWVYTYLQIHQGVYIKHAAFLYCQSYFNEKKKEIQKENAYKTSC